MSQQEQEQQQHQVKEVKATSDKNVQSSFHRGSVNSNSTASSSNASEALFLEQDLNEILDDGDEQGKNIDSKNVPTTTLNTDGVSTRNTPNDNSSNKNKVSKDDIVNDANSHSSTRKVSSDTALKKDSTSSIQKNGSNKRNENCDLPNAQTKRKCITIDEDQKGSSIYTTASEQQITMNESEKKAKLNSGVVNRTDVDHSEDNIQNSDTPKDDNQPLSQSSSSKEQHTQPWQPAAESSPSITSISKRRRHPSNNAKSLVLSTTANNISTNNATIPISVTTTNQIESDNFNLGIIASVPPPTWHSEAADKDHRRTMIVEIAGLLKARKKDIPSEDWLRELPHKARKLEGRLYRAAPSLESYLDRSTLKERLQSLARAITKQFLHDSSPSNNTSTTRLHPYPRVFGPGNPLRSSAPSVLSGMNNSNARESFQTVAPSILNQPTHSKLDFIGAADHRLSSTVNNKNEGNAVAAATSSSLTMQQQQQKASPLGGGRSGVDTNNNNNGSDGRPNNVAVNNISLHSINSGDTEALAADQKSHCRNSMINLQEQQQRRPSLQHQVQQRQQLMNQIGGSSPPPTGASNSTSVSSLLESFRAQQQPDNNAIHFAGLDPSLLGQHHVFAERELQGSRGPGDGNTASLSAAAASMISSGGKCSESDLEQQKAVNARLQQEILDTIRFQEELVRRLTAKEGGGGEQQQDARQMMMTMGGSLVNGVHMTAASAPNRPDAGSLNRNNYANMSSILNNGGITSADPSPNLNANQMSGQQQQQQINGCATSTFRDFRLDGKNSTGNGMAPYDQLTAMQLLGAGSNNNSSLTGQLSAHNPNENAINRGNGNASMFQMAQAAVLNNGSSVLLGAGGGIFSSINSTNLNHQNNDLLQIMLAQQQVSGAEPSGARNNENPYSSNYQSLMGSHQQGMAAPNNTTNNSNFSTGTEAQLERQQRQLRIESLRGLSSSAISNNNNNMMTSIQALQQQHLGGTQVGFTSRILGENSIMSNHALNQLQPNSNNLLSNSTSNNGAFLFVGGDLLASDSNNSNNNSGAPPLSPRSFYW